MFIPESVESPVSPQPWRSLAPSQLEWVALAGAVAMTALFGWLCFAFARSGDSPMMIFSLRYAFAVFAAVAACIVLASFTPRTRWNDDVIDHRTGLLQRITMRWANVAGIGDEAWTGFRVIKLADGTRLRFSPYARNAQMLTAEIARRASRRSQL